MRLPLLPLIGQDVLDIPLVLPELHRVVFLSVEEQPYEHDRLVKLFADSNDPDVMPLPFLLVRDLQHVHHESGDELPFLTFYGGYQSSLYSLEQKFRELLLRAEFPPGYCLFSFSFVALEIGALDTVALGFVTLQVESL